MRGKQGPKAGRAGTSILGYEAAQSPGEAEICRRLREEIERVLPDAASRVWHGAPVWFVGGTPVVGYNVAARGDVVLLFWNGQAFKDPALAPIGKFKAAQARFEEVAEVEAAPLGRWLKRAGTELWDVRPLRRARTRAAARARGAG